MNIALHPKFIYDEYGKKIEAIIPIEEYEELKELLDLVEYSEIYKVIKEREKTSIDKYFTSDEMMNKLGINKNEV